MSFIYIASPYTSPDAKVRQERYLQVSYYFTKLLIDRRFPYSPIVANHHVAQEFNLAFDANAWMAYNFCMLGSAKELHVLKLPGWEQSTGVLAEINFWRAARQGLPISYVDFDHTKALRARKNSKLPGNPQLCLGPVSKDG